MKKKVAAEDVYSAIAKDLREFGYVSTSTKDVREVHAAMLASAPTPHGIVGAFAKDKLLEADDLFEFVP